MNIKELTKAEEEIMQVLWSLGKAFVKDILKELPEPKPAYNTVSTFIRILEQKGVVSYKAYGKTHEYFPLISKEDYKSFVTSKLMGSYFNNSPKAMLSHFIENEEIDLKEANELLELLEKMKK